MQDTAESHDAEDLLAELETMLHDQAELKPDDLALQVKLAKIHAKMGRKESFLADAAQVHRLTKGERRHPAYLQIRDLARGLGVELSKIDRPGQRNLQRRLGEDPASRAYFEELNGHYQQLAGKAEFVREHDRLLLRHFNRPSSLMPCRRWSEQIGGAQIAIKREDLMGGGTKLVMAVTGQVVMAQQLGYTTVVTGSSNVRTGLLMSTMAARMGLRSIVYLNETQANQNSSAVLQMRCAGARIETIDRKGFARDAAMDNCIAHKKKHFFILGVDAAPAPFPELNHFLISALGRETRAQAQSMYKRVPDMLVSRGARTADALGFFDPFLGVPTTRLVAVEAQPSLQSDAASGDRSHQQMELTDAQAYQAEAILEGSEYPSVSREHAHYKDSGRVEYKRGAVTDARRAIGNLARLEGLVVPIRSAYALGWAAREAQQMKPEQLIIVNLIEPHYRDLREVASELGVE